MTLALMIALSPVAAFLVCWLCFVIVFKLDARYRATTCSRCQALIILAAIGPLALGWVIDVGLNHTVFRVMGDPHHTTISGRLKDIRRSGRTGWARVVADLICDGLLNPHAAGHC